MAAAGSMATRTNERPGTRAQVRYVRMSASKARVVLNLIRDKHVVEANELLAFSERLASDVIGKCLRSAVANAVNNDEIPAEELYVSACYADEGPTLKRYRPRARGRAGRIHKQTCHITIVVSRYDEEELDELRRRSELKAETSGRSGGAGGSDAAAARARRVARSRATTDDDITDDDTAADDITDDDAAADDAAEDTVIEDTVENTVIEDTVEATVDDGAEDTVEDEQETD